MEISTRTADRRFEELRHIKLLARQDEYAAVLGVKGEQLRGLTFCVECGGEDYCWTDYDIDELPWDGIAFGEEAIAYRHHMAESGCRACDETGFEGGSSHFEVSEWLELSASASV